MRRRQLSLLTRNSLHNDGDEDEDVDDLCNSDDDDEDDLYNSNDDERNSPGNDCNMRFKRGAHLVLLATSGHLQGFRGENGRMRL